MTKDISGSCMCGDVRFTVKDDFAKFYFCHCHQCQKLTGSAHAANIFTAPDNITWNEGEDLVQRYDHPSRTFSKSFCRTCASALPFTSKSGKFLIVPAGSLDSKPDIQPQANIFWTERAPWYEAGLKAQCYSEFEE